MQQEGPGKGNYFFLVRKMNRWDQWPTQELHLHPDNGIPAKKTQSAYAVSVAARVLSACPPQGRFPTPEAPQTSPWGSLDLSTFLSLPERLLFQADVKIYSFPPCSFLSFKLQQNCFQAERDTLRGLSNVNEETREGQFQKGSHCQCPICALVVCYGFISSGHGLVT